MARDTVIAGAEFERRHVPAAPIHAVHASRGKIAPGTDRLPVHGFMTLPAGPGALALNESAAASPDHAYPMLAKPTPLYGRVSSFWRSIRHGMLPFNCQIEPAEVCRNPPIPRRIPVRAPSEGEVRIG